MSVHRVIFLVPVTTFYAAYLAKMLILRQQGIRGNTLGKGSKPGKVRIIERLIQIITYTGAAVQYASVGFIPGFKGVWAVGFALAALGTGLFVAAVYTMKSSWRAGYSEDQNTTLVTGGIYGYSRNPAFTGFDLLYLGCALAYPNVLMIIWSAAAICVFHLQILSEEKYLEVAFGREYYSYRSRTSRYLGVKMRK